MSVPPKSKSPSAESKFPTVESNKVIVSNVAICALSEFVPLTQSPSKVPFQLCPVTALAVSSFKVNKGA